MMYQKMLVPLDGSELAEVVFTYAKELAGRLDLEVILLLVAGGPALSEFAPMQRAYIQRAIEIIKRQAREVQKRSGLEKEGKLVKVSGEVAVGYPAEEILRYADENAVDLILMATHGRSGRKRWAMGSVASKILGAAKVPVWLVRAGLPEETPYDKWPSKTILVPLDGSDLAETVLPHVEALAKQRATEPVNVVLLRVCEPLTVPAYYSPESPGVPWNWGDYVEQETTRCKQVAAEYLAGIEKRLKNSGIRARSEIRVGRADDEIIGYVTKNPFNLIVIATHGRSGLSRLVYGSVAMSLLQSVSSPIFLVKPQ